jgi:hypothetical protein
VSWSVNQGRAGNCVRERELHGSMHCCLQCRGRRHGQLAGTASPSVATRHMAHHSIERAQRRLVGFFLERRFGCCMAAAPKGVAPNELWSAS